MSPADEVGEVSAGLNGQGVPSLLHVAVGDHGCAASPFGFGGSSFSSVVAAQPELRQSGTGKARPSDTDLPSGSSFSTSSSEVGGGKRGSLSARLQRSVFFFFLLPCPDLHGLNE